GVVQDAPGVGDVGEFIGAHIPGHPVVTGLRAGNNPACRSERGRPAVSAGGRRYREERREPGIDIDVPGTVVAYQLRCQAPPRKSILRNELHTVHTVHSSCYGSFSWLLRIMR